MRKAYFRGIKFKKPYQLPRLITWLLVLIVIWLMLLWNWKLLVATGVGISLILLVCTNPLQNWQNRWRNWQHLWKGHNLKLILAVASGGIGAFSTYIITSIWTESQNHWLVIGTILQSLINIAVLAGVGWYIVMNQTHQQQVNYQQLINNLTDVEPLKRLIAVRQLTSLVRKQSLSRNEINQLGEYLTFMLAVEKEPLIREAVLETLQQWEAKELKLQLSQPLNIPLKVKESYYSVTTPIEK